MSDDARLPGEDDQVVDGAQSGDPDRLKNLQAEMDRKLSNMQDNFSTQLSKLADSITSAVNGPREEEKATRREQQIEDLWMDNPKEAYNIEKERLQREIREEMDRERAAELRSQKEQQDTINRLTNDFPELRDGNHELTQAAVAMFNELPESIKSNPAAAYEMAVVRAAAERGIRPLKARPAEEKEEFTLDSRSRSKQAKRRGETERFNAVLETARKFGMDVDNPDYQERLKGFARRKNFSRAHAPVPLTEDEE